MRLVNRVLPVRAENADRLVSKARPAREVTTELPVRLDLRVRLVPSDHRDFPVSKESAATPGRKAHRAPED